LTHCIRTIGFAGFFDDDPDWAQKCFRAICALKQKHGFDAITIRAAYSYHPAKIPFFPVESEYTDAIYRAHEQSLSGQCDLLVLFDNGGTWSDAKKAHMGRLLQRVSALVVYSKSSDIPAPWQVANMPGFVPVCGKLEQLAATVLYIVCSGLEFQSVTTKPDSTPTSVNIKLNPSKIQLS